MSPVPAGSRWPCRLGAGRAAGIGSDGLGAGPGSAPPAVGGLCGSDPGGRRRGRSPSAPDGADTGRLEGERGSRSGGDGSGCAGPAVPKVRPSAAGLSPPTSRSASARVSSSARRSKGLKGWSLSCGPAPEVQGSAMLGLSAPEQRCLRQRFATFRCCGDDYCEVPLSMSRRASHRPGAASSAGVGSSRSERHSLARPSPPALSSTPCTKAWPRS